MTTHTVMSSIEMEKRGLNGNYIFMRVEEANACFKNISTLYKVFPLSPNV